MTRHLRTEDRLISRERVLRAIHHRETDRLPRDFSAEPPITDGLLRSLGLSNIEGLYQRFKIDMQRVRLNYKSPYEDGRNIWGMRHETRGLTSIVSYHPLAEATTIDEVEVYPWPDPSSADIDTFHREAVMARRSGRAVVGSSWGSVFGESYRLMGMDNFMVALSLHPEVVSRVIDHVTEFFLEVDRRIFETCRGLIDISFHGNDFGTQRGLLISRDMFRTFFAPSIRRLTENAKDFGLRTMFHSCGAISEIIPDLIACGVDILDPIQVTADGMQASRLKSELGERICFHGAISAQSVLPLGNADEVREHVHHICELMKPGGGYILTSDQAITQDTPLENVIAVYDAADISGEYV